MHAFRFIHCADLHLASPFRGFASAPESISDALLDSTYSALSALTDLAIAEQVDFIVIAGDLFDDADRSLRAQLALWQEWKKLEERNIAVYIIHGNHDYIRGGRVSSAQLANVHIFDAQNPACTAFCNEHGTIAHICGVSYGQRHVTENLALSYKGCGEPVFHIGLLHANVDGDASHDPYAPCSLQELTGNNKMQYWALGHIHSRRVLHEYPHVVYSGNTQGRNPRETGAKGCYLVDVSAEGSVDLQFRELGRIRWMEAAIATENCVTIEQLLDRLEEETEQQLLQAAGCCVMLRIVLRGRTSLYERLLDREALAIILEQLQQKATNTRENWIYVYDIQMNAAPMMDSSELLRQDSLTGELERMAQQLLADDQLLEKFVGEATESTASHIKLKRYLSDKLNHRELLLQARNHVQSLIYEYDENG